MVEKEKQKLEVVKNPGRDIGTGREESGHFEVMVVVMMVLLWLLWVQQPVLVGRQVSTTFLLV